MEEGLLSAAGEYAVGDLFKSWELGRSWVIWRQFLLNVISEWFGVFCLTFILVVSWPSKRLIVLLLGWIYLIPLILVSVIALHVLGRKKTITYGFLMAAVTASLSTLTSVKWVTFPLHVLVSFGVSPLVVTLYHDEWHFGGRGRWWFAYMGRCLLFVPAMVLVLDAHGVEWLGYANTVYVGSATALLIALLAHFFLLESPLDILRRCVKHPDIVKRLNEHTSSQEKAIEALRLFARTAGKTLPENLKMLKPEEPEDFSPDGRWKKRRAEL